MDTYVRRSEKTDFDTHDFHQYVENITSYSVCLCLQRQPREVSTVPPLGSGAKMGQNHEEREELRSPHPDPHPLPHAPSPPHIPLPLPHSQGQEVASSSKDYQGKAGKGESDAKVPYPFFIHSDAVLKALFCVFFCVCMCVRLSLPPLNKMWHACTSEL